MSKSLILVSKKPIIVQIFTLVCKKLNIQLEVLNEVQIDHKVDIIIIDNDFIDDRFDIVKSYAKLMGAISKEELPFASANDFIIPLPFLPSSLENILETEKKIIKKIQEIGQKLDLAKLRNQNDSIQFYQNQLRLVYLFHPGYLGECVHFYILWEAMFCLQK